MERPSCSALIRTFNSSETLHITLASLAGQTHPPDQYVFVDSGSTDGTLESVPNGSVVHRFIGTDFNYSDSLNQGLAYVDTDCVLIISSHTTLWNPHALESAIRLLMESDHIGAAYFSHYNNSGMLRYTLVDEASFNGFNGLWNTCSLIKVALLRKRGFVRDVFAAEDQEWAAWLFRDEKKAVACFSGAETYLNNPRKFSRKKRVNEYVCVAYFVKHDLLGWRNLAKIVWRICKQPGPRLAMKERYFNFVLFFRLLSCYLVKPRSRSRYF